MSNHNIYETFRDAIVATVYNTVVKVRDVSTSYNWSLGKVITACAEVCKVPVKDTPDDFKRIVKFEFDKLKNLVAMNNSYELERSKGDFILKDGQIKGRLTNIYTRFIALEEQLTEATQIYSRIFEKFKDKDLSMEKRSTLRKKMNRYLVVIDHTRAEIERQKKLQAEATEAGKSNFFDEPSKEEQEQIKADFKEVVKTIVEETKA